MLFRSCPNKNVIIRTHISDDDEKFGRLLGSIIDPVTQKVLNDELVNNNFAVKYMGENKINVREEHLKNRKILIDNKIIKMTYAEAQITN